MDGGNGSGNGGNGRSGVCLADSAFLGAVMRGLSGLPKRIPSKYLYDARGSQLFTRICGLEAYYVTRTEMGLLRRHGRAVAEEACGRAHIVEFGSGSDAKIRLLLEAFAAAGAVGEGGGQVTGQVTYVPVDICREQLEDAATSLRSDFPLLAVKPCCADFMKPFSLPVPESGAHRLGFFPGSTIGNLSHEESLVFLSNARLSLGAGASFLLGADLRKDVEILMRAYDDLEGVTAAFNLNLLARMNRELGADFDLSAFRHEARWNGEEGRMEMHLVSARAQNVRINGSRFAFGAGESVHTENSRKFTIAEVRELASRSGWRVRHSWVDDDALFSLHYMRAEG